MKKIIILPFLFLTLFSWGQAQFVVQNGTKTEVYSNLNTAIESALAGDTIYLPGGGFTISNATIDKTLHWVGHGHYPSETQATMQTRINSALTFTGDCDNSSFEGIFFTSEVSFGSADNEAENILMKRCRVLGNLYLRSVSTGNPDLNFQISECVLNTIFGNYGSNCLVEKSLIFNRIHYFVQSQFSHNSINVSSSDRIIYICTSCTFVDNVFGYEGGQYNSYSCIFNNNVFAGGLPFTPITDLNGNDGSNNIYNVGSANVYSDISHSINPYTFDYANDYSLNSTATGTDQSGANGISISGTASDGTDTGIYGTTTPYKTIPYYPHINTATIGAEAVNDQLGVNINAQAQNR